MVEKYSPSDIRRIASMFQSDAMPVRRVAKRWRALAAEGDPTYNPKTHEYTPVEDKRWYDRGAAVDDRTEAERTLAIDVA